MITQKELIELYEYNPLTGTLTRRGRQYNSPSKQIPNSNGYHVMMIKRNRYYAHRLVWLYVHGEFPPDGLFIDHLDRNRNNNRIENLRLATPAQNSRNTKVFKTNSSGIMGVRWNTSRKRWTAHISIEGKQRQLGGFDSLFEACCARKSKEAQLGYL